MPKRQSYPSFRLGQKFNDKELYSGLGRLVRELEIRDGRPNSVLNGDLVNELVTDDLVAIIRENVLKRLTVEDFGNSLPVTALGSITARSLATRATDEFNALDHECKFNGVTDDAAAFQALVDLAEAAAPSIIWMPAGKTVWGSTVTVDANKVALVGRGPYQTIIEGNFAAGDILHIDGSAGEIENLYLANFRVTASVVKSSGAGVHLEKVVQSSVEGVIFDGQGGTGNLWHGVHFDGVDNMRMINFEARAQQDGVRVNGANGNPRADLFVWGGKMVACSIGLHIAGDFGGFYVDAVDIIKNDENLVIDQDEVAAGNREIFFGSGCLIDNTNVGAGIRIEDPNLGFVFFDGTWIASATTHGLHIIDSGAAGFVHVDGGIIFNSGSDGIRIDDADVTISVKSVIMDNGGWGINSTVAMRAANISIDPSNIYDGNTTGDVRWDNIEVRAGNGFQVVIADDGVYSFSPAADASGNTAGFIAFTRGPSNVRALVYYLAAGASVIAPIHNSGFTFTTGALTGTTGVDGNETISAHTDGKIYIENRSGAQRRYWVTLLAAEPLSEAGGP